MAEEFRTEGNLRIWQLNRDYRRVWEIDPTTNEVFEFRAETWNKRQGRWVWVTTQAETWSSGLTGYRWGTMAECPELPTEFYVERSAT